MKIQEHRNDSFLTPSKAPPKITIITKGSSILSNTDDTRQDSSKKRVKIVEHIRVNVTTISEMLILKGKMLITYFGNRDMKTDSSLKDKQRKPANKSFVKCKNYT